MHTPRLVSQGRGHPLATPTTQPSHVVSTWPGEPQGHQKGQEPGQRSWNDGRASPPIFKASCSAAAVTPGLRGSRCFLSGQLLPLHDSPPHILLLLMAMPLGTLLHLLLLIHGNANSGQQCPPSLKIILFPPSAYIDYFPPLRRSIHG